MSVLQGAHDFVVNGDITIQVDNSKNYRIGKEIASALSKKLLNPSQAWVSRLYSRLLTQMPPMIPRLTQRNVTPVRVDNISKTSPDGPGHSPPNATST